ncbi:MAG: hypothetical protein AAGJ46_07340 [Planctomycetota bacterium]
MPTTEQSWKSLFDHWPEDLARRGIVVNNQNEAMPFKGFMTRPDMIVLERQNPDSLGARFILLRYDTIVAIKLIDPLKADAFTPFGFKGKLSM